LFTNVIRVSVAENVGCGSFALTEIDRLTIRAVSTVLVIGYPSSFCGL